MLIILIIIPFCFKIYKAVKHLDSFLGDWKIIGKSLIAQGIDKQLIN